MARQSVSKKIKHDKIYKVERILGTRELKGKIEYLIKWKYFDR
jgi:hypothetical protein